MGLRQRMTESLSALWDSWGDFLRRARAETGGNVAMMFGIALPVLLMIVVGAIDINRASTARVTLQDALDAAALAAARSPYTAQEDIQRVGLDALKANLVSYPSIRLIDAETTFTLVDEEVVVANGRAEVKTLVANIFLPPYGQILDDYLPIGTHAEVNRSTKDIEVSIVLDITGSMGGSRLTDLKSAANDLVDLVVQDEQRVNRTRMALVPYSMGVNPGTYATTARGTPRGQTAITDAAWMSAGWSAKTIGGITNASTGVVTVNNHGLATGDFIWISGVADASSSGSRLSTLLNNAAYRVVRTSTNAFTLESWSGSRWNSVSTSGRRSYSANSGTFRKCQISTCEVVVTSTDHGLSTGDAVRIAEVRGMTQINNTIDTGTSTQSNLFRTVTRQSPDTFSLNGVYGADVSTYSSRGYVQCLEQGCQFFKFNNLSHGSIRIQPITNCVSERIGAQAYTDASPSSAPVGNVYLAPDNPCLASVIQPLTSDRDVLHSQINSYAPAGSTAGQIGVGWGWYMISPTFGSIFPAANRPDPYAAQGLLKVVILMTDGEFNTPYCNGVVAGSVSGSGSTANHINCAATNGNPFAQSVTMCTAMKARGVIVYTVGFDISGGNDSTPNVVDTAKEVMERCATTPDHVYLPENGASLKTAFAAIGRSISQLRISK